ncbi:peroxisomal targeting signal 1 receptor isoform X2 [Thrips palmi]|uniref:Peroxisomal targeting signal 1 receptor n=1 Tax=Thrips palmi TaxID=161013 RepID=A0A6P9A8U6_THRPL|nr:peroxisomal targeting signal 1 receptor isoform X2 [Thrips palmi]
MALRDLVEAECGGSNSLVRLTSHFTSDHALKDEGLRHRPFPHHGEPFGDSDQLVQQFLEETLGASPQTFRMDSLLQEMREMEQSGLAPRPSPGVAQLAVDPSCNPHEWAQQFLDAGKHFEDAPGSSGNIWSVDGSSTSSLLPIGAERDGGTGGLSELGFGPKWAQDYLESNDLKEGATAEDLSLVDAEKWIAELTQKNVGTDDAEDVTARQKATELVNAVDDAKFANSKFMKFMRQVGDGEATLSSGKEENASSAPGAGAIAGAWAREFADNWAGEDFASGSGKSSSWEEEFGKKFGAVGRESSAKLESGSEGAMDDVTNRFWDKLQEQWSKMEQDHDWLSEFSDYSDPFKEYKFETTNPMQDIEDPFEEGKRRLEQGDIPSAVLCFESACQATPENSLAWQYLGTSQAENEQDPLAIAALRKCLALDPKNMTALMGLAVSFTNENYQNQACHALKEWLKVNPKYSDLITDDSSNFSRTLGAISSLMPDGIHQNVRDLYIKAARRNPSGTIDPDVQCGLGVLFNLSSEYNKAVDCFKAALEVRQDDFRMWNRLGATLANGNRSEEAVDAYHNALHLFPGFIRARYNLGITCVNLGAHREAAEHLLTALNQQSAGRDAKGERVSPMNAVMSDSIWSTLRLVLGLLDRQDLFPILEARDVKRLNEEFDMD